MRTSSNLFASQSSHIMILLYDTTRARAEAILEHGPDPAFQEPRGEAWEDGFSMNLESGPFLFGTPEEYAHSKVRQFPVEGGPAILMVDVPDEIVQRASTTGSQSVRAWYSSIRVRDSRSSSRLGPSSSRRCVLSHD